MKKSVKTAGIVALSAVLACGALGAFTGCGGNGKGSPQGGKDELTVSIYCGAADAKTNQQICDEWAKDYNKEHGTSIRVTLSNTENKRTYFELLNRAWSSGSTADIIYLAPRYVRTYAERGNILDLSGYLTDAQKELTKDVWRNSISYYGYIEGQRDTYQMGRPIEVKDGKYVTATGSDAGTEVGLYGLPKDYSNFSTGYNRLFFSEELKTAYKTTKATDTRNVQGPKGEGDGEWTSKRTYTGEGDEDVITVNGQPANIINIGVPTTYKPYNFYRFNNFEEALAGRDPMAVMSEAIGGYTVTIPGFPNDVLTVEADDFNAVYTDGNFAGINVPYNKKTAHVTYTYAEYGALIWAITYYLNTFAWQNPNGKTSGYGGTGGVNYAGKSNQAIYGGEQYEGVTDGAAGSVLYLLPWLASNDADLINDLSNLTLQTTEDGKALDANFTGDGWKEKAGTKTYSTTKQTLADKEVTKDIQYGHNSQNFIETYAAFLAIGSDWNGNPSGDTASKDRGTNGNGWGYFRSGRSLFYGAGSWDASTRNDVHTDILDFGQMPTPIAEKYALYSEIKDANYQKAVYANDPTPTTAGSPNEGNQLTSAALAAAKTHTFTPEEILKNQIRRQDKWAARMDTVGYAVAAKVASYTGDHAWKKEAAVDLVARLTINQEAQKTLLYAGAQLPNFMSQCKDFVNYNTTAGAEGWFSDMLTPEGFYDTHNKEVNGKKVWDYYYNIVLEMEEASKDAKNPDHNKTVDEFLANRKHSTDGTAGTEPIRYDKENYGSIRLADFTGSSSTVRSAFAMRVLRMTTYRADDRDINIRMQYGLNAVRDSSMYTYNEDWMMKIDARGQTNMLAYELQKPLASDAMKERFLVGNNYNNPFTSDYVQMNPSDTKTYSYMTPAVWCFIKASDAQRELANAVNEEKELWAKK